MNCLSNCTLSPPNPGGHSSPVVILVWFLISSSLLALILYVPSFICDVIRSRQLGYHQTQSAVSISLKAIGTPTEV